MLLINKIALPTNKILLLINKSAFLINKIALPINKIEFATNNKDVVSVRLAPCARGIVAEPPKRVGAALAAARAEGASAKVMERIARRKPTKKAPTK